MARPVERRLPVGLEEQAAVRAAAAARPSGRTGAARRAAAPSTCARTASSVAKLVIKATGISAPSASPRRAVSSSLTSRKLRPSIASATALTPPPKRVAIPPASTTIATVPARSALDPGLVGLGEARLARLRQRRRDPTAAAARRRPVTTLPRARQRAVGEPAAELARTARRRSRAPRGRARRRDRPRPGSSRAHRRGQRLRVRGAMDALLGHDRRDQVGRGDVERGVARREAGRHLGPVALLDRDRGARRRSPGRSSRSAPRSRTGSRGGGRAPRGRRCRSCWRCRRSRRSGRRR